MALLDSCVAYWRLNEASGTRNDSVGVNHLTDNNTVTQAAGKVGNAAQFVDANDEYLSIADNAALSMGVDVNFTLAAWVWLDATGEQCTLMCKGTFAAEYRLDISTADIPRFWVTAGQFVQAGAAISITAWHLIVAWYDQANLNIQVDNGTVTQTAGTTDAPDQAGIFHLGREPGDTTTDHNGRMDEVAIWKRVLTAPERTQLWNGGAGFNPFGSALQSSFSVGSGI